MKTQANRKEHKRDPYKLLIRLTILLAAVVVVGYGLVVLCTSLVQNDYRAKKAEIDQLNEENELAFTAQMNALRDSNVQVDPTTGEITQREELSWERTISDQRWRIVDDTGVPLENTATMSADRTAALLGGLMLANEWHSLPEDYYALEPELVSVGNASNWAIQVDSGNVKIYPVAYDALKRMIDDAAAEQLTGLIVREGYRTYQQQSDFFSARLEKLSGDYSGDQLIAQAKKSVNYPGTSEYQTGLSFKLGTYSKTDAELTKTEIQASAPGKWVTENCWKYGVVFRFPTADYPSASWEDKSYKTGVSLQMSLYRYVGAAHAAAMRVMDYCLEEYLEFLVDHPHLSIYQDDALKYEIYRIPAGDESTYNFPVPNPASDYTVSLDNMGGLVLAYTY